MSFAARIDAVPGLKLKVAEAYAEGATQTQIAELAGVSDRGTVADWLKRSDVQALVSKCVEERANKILRHTDTKIEKKLQQGGDKISLSQLLKVRREFAGQTVNVNTTDGDKAKMLQKFVQLLDDDPQLAAALKEELPSVTDTD